MAKVLRPSQWNEITLATKNFCGTRTTQPENTVLLPKFALKAELCFLPRIVEQRHESEVHVQLLVTVK